MLERTAPRSIRDLIYRWTSCVVGGADQTGLDDLLGDAGFEQIEWLAAADVFDGARGEENADHYGALGVTVRARRPT